MPDDLILKLSRAVDTAREGIAGPPVWVPLEAMLPTEECAGFMYMGTADARVYDPLGPRDEHCSPLMDERKLVFLYKHGITRKYLNIGEDLSCYVYKPSMCKVGDPVYQRIKTEQAIAHAFADIDQLGAQRSTAYNDEFRAGRNAKLQALGWNVIG